MNNYFNDIPDNPDDKFSYIDEECERFKEYMLLLPNMGLAYESELTDLITDYCNSVEFVNTGKEQLEYFAGDAHTAKLMWNDSVRAADALRICIYSFLNMGERMRIKLSDEFLNDMKNRPEYKEGYKLLTDSILSKDDAPIDGERMAMFGEIDKTEYDKDTKEQMKWIFDKVVELRNDVFGTSEFIDGYYRDDESVIDKLAMLVFSKRRLYSYAWNAMYCLLSRDKSILTYTSLCGMPEKELKIYVPDDENMFYAKFNPDSIAAKVDSYSNPKERIDFVMKTKADAIRQPFRGDYYNRIIELCDCYLNQADEKPNTESSNKKIQKRNIDEKELRICFKRTFIGEKGGEDKSSVLIQDLNRTQLSDKDFAIIANMIWNSNHLRNKNLYHGQFSRWYKAFCKLVGVTFHPGYKPSKLKPNSALELEFSYLQSPKNPL